MEQRIAIIGSKELAQYISDILKANSSDRVVGFLDDFADVGEVVKGSLKNLGKIEEAESLFTKGIISHLVMGIGYTHMEFRKETFLRLQAKIPFYTFIHPKAQIEANVEIGEGCFIGSGINIDNGCKLGKNIFGFPGSVISHDSVIEDHCFLAPRTTLAGFCHVESQSFLGVGCIIINNTRISHKNIIGAGAVVLKDTVPEKTYVGNPAKAID